MRRPDVHLAVFPQLAGAWHTFSRALLPLFRRELRPEPWRGPAELEAEARPRQGG